MWKVNVTYSYRSKEITKYFQMKTKTHNTKLKAFHGWKFKAANTPINQEQSQRENQIFHLSKF